MISFLRLIRWPNLLLIILTQYLLRYCILLPAFTAEYFITDKFPSYLSDFQFALLVAATVMLAAGGYIINDYYDVAVDEINKPEKVIVGKSVSKRKALQYYGLLSAIAIIIGSYLAFVIHKPVMAFVNVFVAASLWMYSSELKKWFLVGNILIAFLSALTILVVGLFEPAFYPNFLFLTVYAGFAFLVSLIREIAKDAEDVTGDARGQVQSLPVNFGIKTTKLVLLLLVLITAWLLGNVLFNAFYVNSVIRFWNLLIFCEIPFAALLFLVATASEKKDFRFISNVTKVIMLLGILSLLPLFYFFIK